MNRGHQNDRQHDKMVGRGVTRVPHGGKGDMTPAERREMQRTHHQKTIWVYFTIVLLGIWLVASPFTIGFGDTPTGDVVRVTVERDLPPIDVRATAMTWSDVISGLLLITLGMLALNPRRLWAPWAAAFVGIWLLFAPLVLWSPSAAAYANDSLVGILVIALTILIPGMPGMILIMKAGPEIPPGWSYNPSAWLQRAPVIAMGWAGFFLGRYLAAYQLGYIDSAWDPFFGRGTMEVLDSEISRAWPISDAGLGATAYTLEALMGFMGGTSRWRTMPWMVLFFGILVVPLGLVSITLVILQPVAVGTWCTLCLLTALAMLIMIPLTLDEVLAMGQFLVRSRGDGKRLWQTFWLGGTIEGGGKDERSPGFDAPVRQTASAMVWGVTLPWSLLASAIFGTWLMFAPAVFQTWGTPIANSSHLVGALVAVVAVIAMAEVARTARFLNLVAGAWIIAAPWLMPGATTFAALHDVFIGVALILLSLPRGVVRERYAGFDRYVK